MGLVDLIRGREISRANDREPIDAEQLLLRLECGAKSYHCGTYLYHLDDIYRQQLYQELETERLEGKYRKIKTMHEDAKMGWNHIFLVGFFDSLSDMDNRDNYKELALRLNWNIVSRERKSQKNLEALLIGMSGLLSIMPRDSFIRSVEEDARYMIHKHQLTPLDWKQWRRNRLTPPNHPIVRLSQVARLLCDNEMPFNNLIECKSRNDVHNLFNVEMSKCWSPYFGDSTRHIGISKCDLIGINFVVPMLYAFGHYSSNDEMTSCANDLNENLPAESNGIIRKWKSKGLTPMSAYETQALIQLKNVYCAERACERCIVYRHITSKSSILRSIPAFCEW